MKKAATKNTVSLILILIAVLILFSFTDVFSKMLLRISGQSVCKASVLKHAAAKEATITETSGPRMECPRHEVVFGSKSVQKDGTPVLVSPAKGQKKSKEYSRLNSHIVNQVVADELYRCADQMGMGEINVFNQPFFFKDTLNLINIDRHPCMICSEISFLDVPANMKFTGLKEYMQETTITHDGKEKSLYGLLSEKEFRLTLHEEHDDSWKIFVLEMMEKYPFFGHNTLFDFTSDQSYIVYFYAGKQTKAAELIGDNYYSVHVDVPEEVQKRCQYIYN